MKKLTCLLLLNLALAPLGRADEVDADIPAETKPAAVEASADAEPPAATDAASASDDPSVDASPAEAAPQGNGLEIKSKSAFTMDEGGRNPFWPIGWKPSAKQSANVEQSAGQLLPTAFLVSSITVDRGGNFAIINGKAMSEGQVFGLQMGNQTYQITVKAIQDGQVILARRDEEIAVPLRRR